MSEDRTLLKLAANAAGLFWIDDCPESQGGVTIQRQEGDGVYNYHWNPLRDDGDALRLAKSIKAAITHKPSNDTWSVGAVLNANFKWLVHDEKDLDRAIVRAAAEIGRGKPAQKQEGASDA